ncbi:NFAT5 [Fasciola gigantica]|uniref:NFAT5 n=1 Tax=Fasciola gigantica TaxID=46835 RepID=A0A504YAL9_FASGI|nr:NFAT5 [Fasciola gigantica]
MDNALDASTYGSSTFCTEQDDITDTTHLQFQRLIQPYSVDTCAQSDDVLGSFTNGLLNSVHGHAGVSNYDFVYSDLVNRNPVESHDRDLLPPRSKWTLPSDTELLKRAPGELFSSSKGQNLPENICSVDYSLMNPKDNAVLTTQVNDPLFTNTMRVLQQSSPLSTGSLNNAYFDDYSVVPTVKEPLSDNVVSKRQTFTFRRECSSISTENGETLIEESVGTAGILPTFRNLLESDSSEILVPTNPERVLLTSQPNVCCVTQCSDEVQELRLDISTLILPQHSNSNIHRRFSVDSCSSLGSCVTLLSSRSCSESPMSSSFYDTEQTAVAGDMFLDATGQGTNRTPCINLDNEDTQSAVIRRYGELQLDEPPETPIEHRIVSDILPADVTQAFPPCSPVLLHDVVPSNFAVDGVRCSDSGLRDTAIYKLSMEEKMSTNSVSIASADQLSHLSQFSFLKPSNPIQLESNTHADRSSQSNTEEITTLMDESFPAAPSDFLLIPMTIAIETKPKTESASSNDSCTLTSNADEFRVDVTLASKTESTLVRNPTSQNAGSGTILQPTANTSYISTRSTPQSQSSTQQMVTKKIRPPPVYHRSSTNSVVRNDPFVRETLSPLGVFSPSAPCFHRRSNGTAYTRDRLVELQSRHLFSNPGSCHPHTLVRPCHVPIATRTGGTGFRASLPQCSIGARKRSNRCAGLVSPLASGSLVGVTPCIRRKCSSCINRNNGSYYSHASIPRTTLSSSTGPVYVDNRRSNLNAMQQPDVARLHQTARFPCVKPALVSYSTARRPGSSLTGCRSSSNASIRSLPSVPSPYQVFTDSSTLNHCQIQMISQPEEQHRARYQTEGSRGAVKDRTGLGYPTVRLTGWNGRASLHVFVASQSGRIRPHSFYQAYMIAGKSTKYCIQTILDGVNVIEMPFTSANDWTLSVDCVGILKLRKSDVELRSQACLSTRHRQLDPSRANLGSVSGNVCPTPPKLASRRQDKARLVFRAILVSESGNSLDVIQVVSGPILCTQIIGDPEINRISLKEAPATGGYDLFILGKNLGRDCRVWFRQPTANNQSNVFSLPEFASDQESVKLKTMVMTGVDQTDTLSTKSRLETKSDLNEKYVWQAEAVLEQEFLHQTHLVCRIPAYGGPSSPITKPLLVELSISLGERFSLSHPFTYAPVSADMKFDQYSNPMSLAGMVSNRDYPGCFEVDLLIPSTVCESKTDEALTAQERFFSTTATETTVSTCSSAAVTSDDSRNDLPFVDLTQFPYCYDRRELFSHQFDSNHSRRSIILPVTNTHVPSLYLGDL